MTEIKSTRNGKIAKVSPRLAKALVSGGKYEYLTREMRPEPSSVPQVQPAMKPAEPSYNSSPDGEAEISPITGKPKRAYKRRAVKSDEEE